MLSERGIITFSVRARCYEWQIITLINQLTRYSNALPLRVVRRLRMAAFNGKVVGSQAQISVH